MQRFIIRENIRHYRKLLETRTDARERARLHELLAEECRKARAHADCDTADLELTEMRDGCPPSFPNGDSHDRHR